MFSGDGFKDTEQANNILRIAEKTCKVEGNVFDERIIQFQSATLNELEKEQIVWMANHKGQQPNPKQSQRYMNFVSQLEALAENNTGADEFVTASEENVKIDPISKKPIKVPVLNRRCNHIYDKESILKAIQVNNKLRYEHSLFHLRLCHLFLILLDVHTLAV